MQSQIQRMNGPINTVNDQVVGGFPSFNGTAVSKVAGQIGQTIVLDDNNVFYSSTVGTVYGGRFQYVKLSAASTTPIRGQILFWDVAAAPGTYTVTTLESGSVPGAQLVAGIALNTNWTAGYFSYIQTVGLVAVKFRAALSHVPQGVGVAVYAAAAGAGADNGFADTIDTADPATFSDVNLMANRYLGVARELPTNAGVKLVYLNPKNLRG